DIITLSLHDALPISKYVWAIRVAEQRSRAMVTVKSSQKIFTDSEVASLTGICVEHVHNFAKSRHLGFIARAAEAAGLSADQWLRSEEHTSELQSRFD